MPERLWKRIKKLKKEKGIRLKEILLKVLDEEEKEVIKEKYIKVCIYDKNGDIKKLWQNYSKRMKAENKNLREISKEIENYLRYL